ncbi:MAG: putative iron-regulated membrane protein [Paraglaciecola sp.]
MKLRNYIMSLRKFRVWHRYLGLAVGLFLLISAITGVLLALKKDVNLLQPPTQKGVSKSLETWKPLSEIATIATTEFHKQYPDQQGNEVNKMDVRPSKGIVKVLFDKGYWEVQIDGTSGEIKSIERRHSDWIESLHDGSIISDWFKLGSMHFLGLGTILMIITGTWLYFGPKKYRKAKQRRKIAARKRLRNAK